MGGHAGAYIPFELNLAKGLSRTGVNRLVVRVDNRQRNTDLPPGSLTVEGKPNGGWWNYGGLLGDVYLRRVDRIAQRARAGGTVKELVAQKSRQGLLA